MKYLCDGCERLVELTAYRLEREVPPASGERLVLLCGKCGFETRSAASTAAAGPLAPQLAQVTAPMRVDPFEAETQPGLPLAELGSLSPGSTDAAPSAAGPQEQLAPMERLAAIAPGGDVEGAPIVAAELPPEVAMPPSGYCAKCIEPRAPGSGPCPRCGLGDGGYLPEPLESSLAVRFVTLLERWDQSELHDALLAEAASRGALPQVGRLYRIRLVRSPGDTQARRAIDELLRLAASAAAGALAARAEVGAEREGSPSLRVAVAGMVLLALLLGLGLLAGALRSGG